MLRSRVAFVFSLLPLVVSLPVAAQTGTIVISKVTAPAGGTGFQFSDDIVPGNFTLGDGSNQTFTSVSPGVYTVVESDPSGAGYTLADVSCDDANSFGNVNARSATIDLASGETVRCTFRNFQTSVTDDLFVFHLSGDQEVPPVPTLERGGCMARFDSGASELSLVCTHDVALPTVMHIHQAAAGGNGPIVFDLGDPTSPVVATWSGMTPTEVAELFAGNLYVNIHTAGRPAGAIRGQILPRTADTIAFGADGSEVVPPNASTATASCSADLSNDATGLAILCTHNLAAPVAAHVHQAARGVTGPIAFTFASPASPLSETMPVTPRLVADFVAGFLYLDIHAAADEIRGQLAAPPAAAELALTKTASVGPYVVGEPVAFTITVTNAGPAPATGVTVTDSIPAGTTLVSATPSQGSCSGVTTVTCTLGTILNGANATIELIVTLPSTPGQITNSASVTRNEVDTDATNDSDSVIIDVEDAPVIVPVLPPMALLMLGVVLSVIAVMRVKG